MEKPPLVQNAGDAQQVEEARKAEKRDRKQEVEDLRMVVSTREGRRFYRRLMADCELWLDTAQASGHNPYQTAYLDGKRSIGIKLMRALTDVPASYQKMADEEREEIENAAR